MSNQSLRQASIRAVTGTTGTLEEDWLALFDQDGIQAGTFNERLYAWLEGETGLTGRTIDELKVAFAILEGVATWNSLGTFDASGVQIPAAPVIDLLAVSDRGASTTDDITNDTEPQFSIDVDSNVQAGDTVHVYDNAVEIGTGITLTAGQAAGTDPLFLSGSPLADGTHPITMTVENSAGESAASNEISLVIDTSLGTVAASISGDSTTDTTPDITVTISTSTLVAGDEVEVRASDGTVLGTHTLIAGDISGGTATVTLSELALGSHTVTVYGYDASGNFTAEDEYTFEVVSAAYTAQGVSFDGTNDYLTRGAGLTGAADGRTGMISFWFWVQGNDGQQQIFVTNALGRVLVRRDSSGAISVGMISPTNTARLSVVTTTTYTSAMSGWAHFIVSWDLTAGRGQIYVDRVSVGGTPTINNNDIDYTDTDWAVGATTAGAALLNADLADLYVNLSASLDLSTSTNLDKFVTSGLKPVDLGLDGSTPTGTAPIMFFSGATAAWHTNKGTGGGLTENGALTDAASSPSA